MKTFSLLTVLLLAGVLSFSAQTNEVEQMKSDLIGHTMGGRERCWKFQSVDQIKKLTIQKQSEQANQRIYTITLLLQATNAPAQYTAQARVEYDKTDGSWKIKHVGLLSLKKIK